MPIPEGVEKNPVIKCPQCKGRHRVLTLAVRKVYDKEYGKYFCNKSKKIVYEELVSV